MEETWITLWELTKTTWLTVANAGIMIDNDITNKRGQRVMEKNINIRVQAELLEKFELACEKSYTTKSAVLRQAMIEYVATNGLANIYKTEKIQHKDGEYIPGSEDVLREGYNELLALASFDLFQETSTETAIVSKYIPEERRWEIIREK